MRWSRLSRSFVCRAALSGVFVACGASSAFAQGAPPKPAATQPAAPKPAATTPAAKPAAGAPATPKPTPAKPKPKPRTEKEKKEAAKLAFGAANEKIALGDYAGAYLLFKEADEYVPGAGFGFLNFDHSTICRACSALSTIEHMMPPTPVSSTRITV